MILPSALHRRRFVTRSGAAAAAILTPSLFPAVAAAPAVPRKTGMGLVIYNCARRRDWLTQQAGEGDLYEPRTFLEHCHQLGAGGMQARLGVMDRGQIARLRDYAQRYDLYIDAIVSPPSGRADLDRFEAEIATASQVGVQAARTTIIPGRRYERFETRSEFLEYERRGQRMLERAAPIVEKYGVPLAVENHKDQRIEERVALLRRLSSEFVGACVDTGNSVALIDGIYEPIEALAPYAFSVHLKDQALQEYSDGFLLGDIPLGRGSFDLKRMVQTIRRHKPDIRFTLELITRDPLKVPCLTQGFWNTFDDVPAADLAKTLRFVRQHSVDALQHVSHLPISEQVELEDRNVAASLQYAGEELGL